MTLISDNLIENKPIPCINALEDLDGKFCKYLPRNLWVYI